MSTSPSEFLTFYRRLATSAAPRLRPVQRRTFVLTPYMRAHQDMGAGKQHQTRKNDGLNVQGDSSIAGRRAKEEGTGGRATTESDHGASVKKAKQEHPAAPDPAIGFQDERGNKHP